MPLFETLPVDEEEIKKIVEENWFLSLGKCLKQSQNHTFLASSNDDKKFVVRVTPDPKQTRQKDITLELALLDYLHKNNLPVSKSVLTKTSPERNFIRSDSACIISVFEYAPGEPVNFVEWKWLTEKEHVVALGRWIGRLHVLTKRFAKEYPQLYALARNYTEIHDGILAEVPIDKLDLESISDPSKYGLIHGDVNVSNYFWDASIKLPQVFDWDQSQKAWFLYDLSSPIWTVVTIKEGGNPVDQSPVPQADIALYTDWILEGYEESGKIDREALNRMIALRKQLYKRFCSRAIHELEPDSFMYKFCLFMATWLNKE